MTGKKLGVRFPQNRGTPFATKAAMLFTATEPTEEEIFGTPGTSQSMISVASGMWHGAQRDDLDHPTGNVGVPKIYLSLG